ncbi:MAG: hypothetical protein ACOVQM_11250 [Pirellula sp.]
MMNWLAVRGICLLVIGCFAANGFAQTSVSTDEIFVDEGTGVVITNGRRCVDPNGPTATARCREVTTEEARPCPSGSCFSWGRGCKYIDGNDKESQTEQLNEGSFTNPLPTTNPANGKKVKPDPQKIVCYKTRQCTCEGASALGTAGRCTTGEWKEYAIAKYETLDEKCPELNINESNDYFE